MDADRARRGSAPLAGAVTLALVIAGCGTWIPPGAQQVHVTGTATEVLIQPATAHAGDIYFVVDGSALLIWHAGEPKDGMLLNVGGLSDDELDSLARTGSQFQTGLTVLAPGYAGNVQKWTFPAGKYAFFPVVSEEQPEDLLMQREALCSEDLDACSDLPPLPMTVLEVLP